jgi:hypothetical protein
MVAPPSYPISRIWKKFYVNLIAAIVTPFCKNLLVLKATSYILKLCDIPLFSWQPEFLLE